ncbi:MAG TPA: quinone-dependent dihydroorotate dehydrogenase, partial [Oligoflexia bacterium]|nr:quinone-dependent dihydroorotate dehydrogenase [Oligoflexia bacterium]
MIYKSFVKPLLFRLDPEVAHNLMVRVCSILWQFRLGRALSRFIFSRKTAFSTRSTNLAGLKLKNPIGLAAGFDKSGELAIGLETLGFGFIEIGTVTPRPQAGNPKPRLFRDPVNLALINRMGFNNDGAIVVAERLRRSKKFISIPVGVNIGKNKDTPIERAVEDYRECARAFRGLADYLTVNISSPNTPGLRDLQNVAFLTELATSLNAEQLGCPVFLKLAPEVTG